MTSAAAVAGLNVCIVGINYAPEQTGIAPYTTALARELVARGARVDMITGMPHYPQWRVEPPYSGRWSATESDAGVALHRVRHFVPRRQAALTRIAYELTFGTRALVAGTGRAPDVVLGIIPSLAGGLAGLHRARRAAAGFGVLVQDLMGLAAAQSGIAHGRSVAGLTTAVETSLLRRADRVAVVAPEFATYLEGQGIPRERMTLVRNWSHITPPSRPRAGTRAKMGWTDEQRVVLHAGNIGNKQGLEHVIPAARLALERDPALRFVLMGDGNRRASLEALAADLPNVQFVDPQPADWFPDILAAADVLLLHERRSARFMSLPSKLTSYFAARVPVVAAIPPDGTTAAELKRADSGVVVPSEDAEALLGAIRRVLADPALARALTERGHRYVTTVLSRENALDTACAFIAGLARRQAQGNAA